MNFPLKSNFSVENSSRYLGFLGWKICEGQHVFIVCTWNRKEVCVLFGCAHGISVLLVNAVYTGNGLDTMASRKEMAWKHDVPFHQFV